MDMPRLCVRSKARQFGPGELTKLVGALDVQSRDGLVEECGLVCGLEIDRDGLLEGGYRYTDVAYRQICSKISQGLVTVTLDFSGVDRDPDLPREEFSFELARRMFNRALATRYDRIAGRFKVLRDVRTRLVEGFVGAAFQPLSNTDLLEQAITAAETLPQPATFAWATLVGRLLVVRCNSAQVLCSPEIGEDGTPVAFRIGLHFANSEIGDQSVFRVAVPLIRDADGAASLGPHVGRRLYHRGQKLAARVAAAFASVSEAAPSADYIHRRFLQLGNTRIDFGDPRTDERRSRIRELAGRIRDLGVNQKVANRLVAEVAAASGMPRLDDNGVRTAYDIYSSLVVAARPMYISNRELTEQTAYKVLLGKIRFG